ncbi:MAG TPA: GTPase HflX [Abditibacteriaceae bacterium]|jgi:GTP-binding protein HflX
MSQDNHNGTEPRNGTSKNSEPARDAAGYISTQVQPERVIISQLVLDGNKSSTRNTPFESEATEEESLDELAGLCEAANAVVVGSITQRRDKPHAATLFGKGKVEEIGELCREHEADVLVVDHELTPAQGRNLENALKVRVVDRTELILDIFARRAQTRQAKLQVELAQLRYQLPRLKRMWTHLERTGGGIGTRGPGETQLETDRRLAGERIAYLQKQLDEIRKQKQTESVGRADFQTGALVGYTNVGKSALLNALSRPTGKGVLVANQLFATLGASTRRVELGQGRDVLLSDTVGFVRRLPHNLVECFHSTLAEVEAAEFLLLVANAADPELDDKMRAVRGVLNDELNVAETPQIVVLNQSDRLSHEDRAALLLQHRDAVFTSALTGEGLDELRARILQVLEAGDREISLTLDASDEQTGKLLADIARHGRVLEESWSANSGSQPQVHVRAKLAPRWCEKLGISDKLSIGTKESVAVG